MLPDLDLAKPGGDPDYTGLGSGKTGSRSGCSLISIRQNWVQIRLLPELDPAKTEPDPVTTGPGYGSGLHHEKWEAHKKQYQSFYEI